MRVSGGPKARFTSDKRGAMLSRKSKAFFYSGAGPLMRLNGILYRYFRAPRFGTLKVHLGPGQRNYLEGWVNVDANVFTGKCDVWADLRNPLPFHSSTVDAMYSHHVIEHLPDLGYHFKEVFRCLKPGGVYRVGGPNGDAAAAKLLEGDKEWFSDFPDKRSSIGGRFENFVFCRQEHLTVLTFSFLEEIAEKIGFRGIRRCKPVVETGSPGLFLDCMSKEYESDLEVPHTLIAECTKADNGVLLERGHAAT